MGTDVLKLAGGIGRGRNRMDANGRTEQTRSQSGGGRPKLRPRNGVAKSGHEAGSGNDALERRAIAAAKRGEWDAIHYLYVHYADDVFAYVRSILGDHHAAEDVTQNVFAKLMSAIQRYEERGAIPFAGWI